MTDPGPATISHDPWRKFTPAQRWRRVGITVGVVVLVIVGLPSFLWWHEWNYPKTYGFGATEVAGKVTFDRYESEYTEAALAVKAQAPASDYSYELPDQFRFLTADGFVGVEPDYVFFPLWLGIPDDAGGYFYVPSGTFDGADMYGMPCTNPVRMNDEWWACGLSEEGGKLPRLDSNQ